MKRSTFWFYITFAGWLVSFITGNVTGMAVYSAAMCIMMYIEAEK